MPQGDKYISLTNYLRNQQSLGSKIIRLTFLEVENILGFKLSDFARKYPWSNDRTQSISLGWLNAGFIVVNHDLSLEKVEFHYNIDKSNSFLSGNDSKNSAPRYQPSINRRKDIPHPCKEEVEFYLHEWQALENYRMQENALDKLFFELCPNNINIEDILIKASTLNDFYSTNIYSIFPVAKHILSLNIDSRLKKGDVSLLTDLAMVTFPNGKKINLYSFASKYCSHHNPIIYPIYDVYIDRLLKYFRDVDNFATFKSTDLRNYVIFNNILQSFRSFYDLEQYSLKQIDQYLWQLGKKSFPKKY